MARLWVYNMIWGSDIQDFGAGFGCQNQRTNRPGYVQKFEWVSASVCDLLLHRFCYRT